MYEEINRLWVSCVSRWGCLSDSAFNVFANPECICTNKKIFDWERERERESTKTLSTTPLELRIYCIWLVLARMQVMFDFTIFSSTIIWNSFCYTITNSQSPCYLEMWMTRSVQLNFFVWLQLQKQESGEEMISWHGNMFRKPQGYSELLLDTACHRLSILGIPGNTDCKTQITLTRDADHRTQNTRRGRGGVYAQRRHWNVEYVRIITWPPPHSPLDPWLKTWIHYLLTEHHFLSCSTIILNELRWTGGESCCYASYRPQTWQPGLNYTPKNSWAKMSKEYIWARTAVLSQNKLLLLNRKGWIQFSWKGLI